MKSDYKRVFVKNLIEDKDFMLLRQEDGSLDLDRPVLVLTRESQGTAAIVEILDADAFTAGEIEDRLRNNITALSGIKARAAYSFLEVFVFDSKPEPGKRDILISNQYKNVPEKRFLQCMSIDLSDRTVEQHFQTPISDFGIAKIAGKILSEGMQAGTGVSEILELVIRKEKENRLELKVKTPAVTYSLIAINALVAALIYLYSLKTGKTYDELLLVFGAKVNADIMEGQYWRFLTPVFLHGGVMHLLINSYSLYAVGVSVERIFGRFRFLAVYFIAGVLGNLLSFLFSQNPGVGASGAIFGMLGALLYFGLEKPALFKRIFGNNILVTIVINLAYGFSNTGIDNFAHIGGLIGGFLASGIFGKPEKSRWYFNRVLYIALTVCLAVSGLVYGFHSKQNRVLSEIRQLDALDKAQNWSGAETKAEEILALDPDAGIRSSVLWVLVKAEAMEQKYEEAVKHAREMIPIDPPNGHYILGLLYYDQQKYDLSKTELLEAKKAGAAYEQIDQILAGIGKQQGK